MANLTLIYNVRSPRKLLHMFCFHVYLSNYDKQYCHSFIILLFPLYRNECYNELHNQQKYINIIKMYMQPRPLNYSWLSSEKKLIMQKYRHKQYTGMLTLVCGYCHNTLSLKFEHFPISLYL